MGITDRTVPVSANVPSDKLRVRLADQRVIGLPLSAFPWLRSAIPGQQQNVQTDRTSLYWPDLEDGIALEYVTGEWTWSDSV